MKIVCNTNHEEWLLTQLAKNNTDITVEQLDQENIPRVRQTTRQQTWEGAITSLCNPKYNKQGTGKLPEVNWIRDHTYSALRNSLCEIAIGKKQLILNRIADIDGINYYISNAQTIQRTLAPRVMMSTEIDLLICYALLSHSYRDIHEQFPALAEHVAYHLQQANSPHLIADTALAQSINSLLLPGNEVDHPRAQQISGPILTARIL